MTGDPLEDLKHRLEWNCNETNNHHCRIGTRIDEARGRRVLRVWPRHDETGEPEKVTGWASVWRDAMAYERDRDVVVSGEPGEIRVAEL
jgi:hypothetical protein